MGRAAAVLLLLPAASGAWRRGGLVAPATDAQLSVPLEAALEGSGSGVLDWLSLRGDAGEARRGGHRYQLVAYASQAGFGGYDLADALAVREDGGDVMVLYGYCYQGRLASVWTEGYGLRGSQEALAGSCALRRGRNRTLRVRLPALRALPEPLGAGGGLSVRGARVALEAGGGWIVTRRPGGSGTVNQTLRPFGLIDCTACPGGPWLEVHAMLDTAPTGACFGILYVFPEKPHAVELGYSICMPSMDRVDATYEVGAAADLEFGPTDGALAARLGPEALGGAAGLPRRAVAWPSGLPRRPPPSRLALAGPPATADPALSLVHV